MGNLIATDVIHYSFHISIIQREINFSKSKRKKDNNNKLGRKKGRVGGIRVSRTTQHDIVHPEGYVVIPRVFLTRV